MTPAEKLAAQKQRKRPPRNTVKRPNPVWVCRVREVRESFHLSLRDVADAIGMSNPGLFAIEHGSDPMLTTAYKLAEFFGMSIPELWPAKAEKDDHA